MEPSGVSPVLPVAVLPGSGTGEVAARRAAAEDEVLASWLDVLVADGLFPSRAILR